MRKNLISSSMQKQNQRGVAVIFTLGILGLLTVMALGFASTALLNNSLSKNVMNSAYARGLAKNLALTQVMYIISQKEIDSNGGFVDYRKVYTWGTDANSTNHKDFLWKLDYAAAQYQNDPGVQIYKYEPDKAASNPANNVRWQYVKDTNNKLIGRYAYVVIPDKGRLDPSVNLGRLASEASAASPAAATFSNVSTQSDLKQLETLVRSNPGSVDTSAWNSAFSNSNKFRWATYRELIKKVAAVDAFYMFQYNGITPSLTMKSPEAFLKNGELYSRFNMNRSDWNTMTAKKLCGIKDDDSYEEWAVFPDEQKFIPWLQDMCKKSDDLKTKALQIAANIIQYNRPAGQSVSDKPDSGWLTDPPSYVGVGRHPMLNEIGFSVRIKADCTSNKISDDPEIWEYEPMYIITIDNGTELVYPFGMTPASKCFVNFSNDMEIVLKLRAVNKASDISQSETDLEKIFCKNEGLFGLTRKRLKLSVKGNTVQQKIEKKGFFSTSEEDIDYLSGWTSFDFSREFDNDGTGTAWAANSAYTKAEVFWKGVQNGSEQQKTITFGDKFKLNGSDRKDEIKKLMYFYSFDIKLGNAVLYSGDTAGNETQCDFSAISGRTASYASSGFTDWAAPGEDISTNERLLLCSIEAKDPWSNQKASDWGDIKYKFDYYSSPSDINKNYPGTVFDKDSGDPDEDKHHKNADDVPTDPACVKTTEEGITTYTRLETAFVRHGQMLSFWELGCISRGEAWKTLNLLKKDNSASPDFSYNKGDAVLFDQLKFTDENYTAGKINLNTDVHQVLEKIFNSDLIKYKQTLGTVTSATMNDLLLAGSDPGEGETPVKITAQALDSSGNPVAHTEDSCLACCLIKATKTYNLKNRGDLLSEQSVLPTVTGETKPVGSDWTAFQTLFKSGSTDLEKIQIVSKLMPLLRTAPVDSLRVVILAQSIRDVGGDIPVLVDWDGQGFDAELKNASDANKKKALWKAGYRRTIDGNKLVESESEGVWKEPDLTGTDASGSKLLVKTYTKNAFGTYDLGRDKITGETKLVATLVRDPEKKKWKLVRLQYVE